MKEKLALVIAALMITSMAFAISTTSVSATHATPTVSLSPDFVKEGESYVFTLSVTNEGGDLIDTVEIVNLGGFASINSMLKLPKDNIVSCDNVTLADGTLVTVVSDSVTVPENTELLVLEGENIYFGDFLVLLEDALVEVPNDTDTSLVAGAEVTVKEQEVAIDTDLRLLADTPIDNENILPEDTSVELVAENDVTVAGDLTLAADNEVNLENNVVRLVNNVTANFNGLEFTILAGEIINLTGENTVVLLAGTVVEVVSASVTVAENEDVTISGGTVVTPSDPPVPVPEGWTPSVNMWSGTADNIAVGETVEFPFSATAPPDNTYNITVKTTDVNNYEALVVITLTSDGTPPSVTAAVSPSLVGLATVTITVEASEKLSELGKVIVTQSGAVDENVFTITMTSANGINWTGTYTVITDHDNTAVVAIENSTDLVGNVGGADASAATFTVDTIAPNAPIAVSTPASDGDVILLDSFVNQPNQLVYGVSTEAEVRIRVNADTITTTPRADDNYSVAITLVEGTNEVGVSLVDLAGNASEENVQEVVLDSLPPTVEVVSIAGKGYVADLPINNDTPTIVVKMLDAVSGVDIDNSIVELNGVPLDNANVWDPETGLFENTVATALPENTYTITVTTMDLSGVNPTVTENFTFVVDVTAPTMPSTLDAVTNPVLYGTSAIDPKVQKATALVLYGSDVEAASTVKIYLINQATGTGISTATTTADATGNFSKSVTLAEGKVVRIEVETIDAAGNVSSRLIYGYAMADATAPSVTLAELSETTDKTSITISGTVTKDAWEDWSDITLTVQVGTGRVVVPIGAGGSYSYSLALSEGPNTIVVQATDYVGNASTAVSATVERTVTPWMTYAIVLVIVALLMAVIAIFRK